MAPPAADLADVGSQEVSQPTGEEAQGEIDIINDVLRRVRDLLPSLPAVVVARVEADARQVWGGDRPYIHKVGDADRFIRSRRNEMILADHRRGERAAFLSRRYGLSEQRVRQIIAGLAKNASGLP